MAFSSWCQNCHYVVKKTLPEAGLLTAIAGRNKSMIAFFSVSSQYLVVSTIKSVLNSYNWQWIRLNYPDRNKDSELLK